MLTDREFYTDTLMVAVAFATVEVFNYIILLGLVDELKTCSANLVL